MFARLVALAIALWPVLAAAEPITLKLSFFSSDRTQLYLAAVKPFVDAVNSAGKGRVKIDVHFSDQLGGGSAQSRLIVDGKADIAYVVMVYERAFFPDAAVMELPGLYGDAREATPVFSRLVADGTIRGFADEFFTIGAFTSEPESIHTRPLVASLADLRGKRIRASNDAEIEIFKKLGVTPDFVSLKETAEAISSGRVDGAAVPPIPLMEFGIARVTPNHYFLPTSCVPLALLMNRKKFEGLPPDIQAIIREHSGDWFSENYLRVNDASTALVMNQLEADPRRKLVKPSQADMQRAGAIFKEIVESYAAASPHNAQLVGAARSEVAKLRLGR